MSYHSELAELVATCHWIGARGWCPATGGNMSLRLNTETCLVTESGKDKGSLSETDFLHVRLADNGVADGRRPSAETGLHTLIYRLLPEVGAVLHTHSVNATVLSRVEKGAALSLSGYEMQKSLSGQHTHLDEVLIPIFDNDQDIDALAMQVAEHHQQQPLACGFLVRGHGLYCFGRTVAEARRHLDGLEFLFQCELSYRLLEAK